MKFARELIRLNKTLNQEQLNNLQNLYDVPPVYSDPNLSYSNDNYSSYESFDDNDLDDKIDVSDILENLGINSDNFERALYRNNYTMANFIDGKIPKYDMENIMDTVLQIEAENTKMFPFEDDLNNSDYNESYLSLLINIYKKELNTDKLYDVSKNVYNNIEDCINDFKQKADDSPISRNKDLLEQSQAISKEICKHREHKIFNFALNNVHKYYSGIYENEEPYLYYVQFPDNLTPGEKKLYQLLTNLLNWYHTDFILDNTYSEESDLDIFHEYRNNHQKEHIDSDKIVKPNNEIIFIDDSYWEIKEFISKEDFLAMVQYYKKQIPSMPTWKLDSMVVEEILAKNT